MTEEWRSIPNCPQYEASSHGRIRRDGKVLKLNKKPSGHLGFTRCFDAKKTGYSVHVAVLEAFVGPRPEGMWACHRDDNGHNNHITNLRWDTPSSNFADKKRLGNQNRVCGRSNRLTVQDVWRIREAALFGAKQSDLAAVYGLESSAVSRIVRRQLWKHA